MQNRPLQDDDRKDQPRQKPQNSDPSRLDKWQDRINSALEEAMRQGVFDNLPGKGKPLNLNEDPNEPLEMRMANKILKNNDLTPPWIADRKAILAEIEQIRAEMHHKWEWVGSAPAAHRAQRDGEWQRALKSWEGRIADLNRRILNMNLGLPIRSLEVMRMDLKRECTRLNAPYTPTDERGTADARGMTR